MACVYVEGGGGGGDEDGWGVQGVVTNVSTCDPTSLL